MLYQALGLEFGASESDVRRSYRELALKYHPDKNPNDETAKQKFQSINLAHQVLSSAASKQRYDEENIVRGGWGTSETAPSPYKTPTRPSRHTTSFSATTPRTPPAESQYTPEERERHRQNERERLAQLAKQSKEAREVEQRQFLNMYRHKVKVEKGSATLRESEFEKLARSNPAAKVRPPLQMDASTNRYISETQKITNIMEREREKYLDRLEAKLHQRRQASDMVRRMQQEEEAHRMKYVEEAITERDELLNYFDSDYHRIVCRHQLMRLQQLEASRRYDEEQIALLALARSLPIWNREGQGRTSVFVQERLARSLVQTYYAKDMSRLMPQETLRWEESRSRKALRALEDMLFPLLLEEGKSRQSVVFAERSERWFVTVPHRIITEGMVWQRDDVCFMGPPSHDGPPTSHFVEIASLEDNDEDEAKSHSSHAIALLELSRLSALQKGILEAQSVRTLLSIESENMRSLLCEQVRGSRTESFLLQCELSFLEAQVAQSERLLGALSGNASSTSPLVLHGSLNKCVMSLMQRNEEALARNEALLKENRSLNGQAILD